MTQRTPRVPVVASILLGTLLAATHAAATLYVRVADAALVRQVAERSGAIVEVEAAETSPAYNARIPSTDQRMVVQRVVFGQLAEDALDVTVRWRGGETADGAFLHIRGVRPLAAGARALLFIQPGDDGTWDVMHLFQGAFEIARIDGQDYAFRAMAGTEVEPASGDKQFHETERARDLGEFTAWIRGVAAGQAPGQRYWRDLAIDALAAAAAAARGPAKYTLFDDPFRWTRFDADLSVSLRAHESGQPGLAGGGFSEFAAAIAAWNNDAGSNVRYNYVGTTAAANGFNHNDGVNAILFDDLNGAGDFDEPFDCSDGGVIATGGAYAFSNDHTHQGLVFGRIFEADIVTNKNTGCILGTASTAREVFGHELGHTLGLGHSCGDGSSGSCAGRPVQGDALMRATAHADGRGARLNSDDKAGINFLYPAAPELPPNAPGNLSASNGGFGVVNLSWSDNSSNESGFGIERRVGTGSFSQIATTGAGTSSYQDGSVPTGTSVGYRVRAFNSAGSSGYSNTATVNTTGPPAPSNLAVTVLSHQALQLDWTDNTADETEFEVQIRRQGSNFAFAKIGLTGANETQRVFDELFSDSSFQFRIRAVTPSGNSSWSPAVTGATLPYPAGEPCVPGDATLCLNGGRFQNRVLWREFAGLAGLGRRVEAEQSLDSGMFWFFGSDNWEMLVKNLDACGLNQAFWVFSAATTNVEYSLQVVDTWTGDAVTYFNPLGTAAPAVTDIGAFVDSCGVAAPAAAESLDTSEIAAVPDKVDGCVPATTGTDSILFLYDGRFEVEVDWRDFQNGSGPGKVVEFCSDGSGLFWFFGSDNWELLVKVLDGCTLNERYWVFSAATTNVEYTLRVTDRLHDQTKTYFNPLGQASDAVTDTSAFATCP